VSHTTLLIAHLVQRLQHFFCKTRAFIENGFDNVGRRIGEAGQVVVAFVAKDVVKDEKRVFYRGLVAGHWALSDIGPKGMGG